MKHSLSKRFYPWACLGEPVARAIFTLVGARAAGEGVGLIRVTIVWHGMGAGQQGQKVEKGVHGVVDVVLGCSVNSDVDCCWDASNMLFP